MGLDFVFFFCFYIGFIFNFVFMGEFNMKYYNLFKYKLNVGGGSLEVIVIILVLLMLNDRLCVYDCLFLLFMVNIICYVKVVVLL